MQDEHLNWALDCTLSLNFDSEEDANIFYSSYIPEHGSIPKKRSEITLKQSEEKIIFTLRAKDITAFRASMNSILQFSTVVIKIVEKVNSIK